MLAGTANPAPVTDFISVSKGSQGAGP
jgi:hypothetical protein